jgi:hypothetical protein
VAKFKKHTSHQRQALKAQLVQRKQLRQENRLT